MMKKILFVSILIINFSINIFALASKEQELFDAIKENKYESHLKNLLRYKMDLNAVNEIGFTPLLYAVECGNERAVKVLLEYSDVNIEYKLPDNFYVCYPENSVSDVIDNINIGGATPLMYAIFKGNAKIVRQLIDKNANIKAEDNDGVGAFLYACAFGNGNIIRMLLVKDRALVYDKIYANNINGLHYAAIFNNLNTINFLIKNVDMDINNRDSDGCTALYHAAYHQKNDAYNLLIKLGADKDIADNYGISPEYVLSNIDSDNSDSNTDNAENNNINSYDENMSILRAIYNSDTNALRNIIMYSNFNMNAPFDEAATPLIYAISLNKEDMVYELLSYRMNNTNIINIETSYIKSNEVYADLREREIEFAGNAYMYNASPLQYAIFEGNTNIINTLLKYRADIYKKDAIGDNALMYAAKYGNAETVNTILNYGSNSYRVVDIYGNTPLHKAAAIGNTNSLIALISRTPININIQNINGDTPLHEAAKNNNSSTYRFLLLKGADYTIRNYDGKTASDLMYIGNIDESIGSIESIIRNNTNNNMHTDFYHNSFDTNYIYETQTNFNNLQYDDR